jgi:ubiquinone/menaquinone biosynthesis C-methylase UbiE
MVANSPALPGDHVLDVAAGTALFGRALASRVAEVVAIDITPEMLRTGKAAAGGTGVSNVTFLLGDATALPFRNETFDRTISRLAVHHFTDPLVAVREMARVCRIGGSVTVIDLVVTAEGDADWFNELQHLRDHAHTRALTRAELRIAIEGAGLSITHESTWTNVVDAERWLEQTETRHTDAEIIRAAWSAELEGGPSTGMEPRAQDGRIEIVHHWDLVVAEHIG